MKVPSILALRATSSCSASLGARAKTLLKSKPGREYVRLRIVRFFIQGKIFT